MKSQKQPGWWPVHAIILAMVTLLGAQLKVPMPPAFHQLVRYSVILVGHGLLLLWLFLERDLL
ncbi:MAG TPA: hypothetical protein VNK95_23410 [Caldilineaceae bacterium]|nr:hypothetical protein [Caldilineaceae bacterium]